jgi:hypothetical protein
VRKFRREELGTRGTGQTRSRPRLRFSTIQVGPIVASNKARFLTKQIVNVDGGYTTQ